MEILRDGADETDDTDDLATSPLVGDSPFVEDDVPLVGFVVVADGALISLELSLDMRDLLPFSTTTLASIGASEGGAIEDTLEGDSLVDDSLAGESTTSETTKSNNC